MDTVHREDRRTRRSTTRSPGRKSRSPARSKWSRHANEDRPEAVRISRNRSVSKSVDKISTRATRRHQREPSCVRQDVRHRILSSRSDMLRRPSQQHYSYASRRRYCGRNGYGFPRYRRMVYASRRVTPEREYFKRREYNLTTTIRESLHSFKKILRSHREKMDILHKELVDGMAGWNERQSKLEERVTVLEQHRMTSSTSHGNRDTSSSNTTSGQVLSTEQQNNNHQRRRTPAKDIVPCPHCAKPLSRSYIWKHVNTHCKVFKDPQRRRNSRGNAVWPGPENPPWE